MKIVKLFSMAMLCMVVALVSCSGEDGERGPQGSAGASGADGQDGQDGQNGNANVQSYKIDMGTWQGGEIFEFDIPIAAQDRSKYAFFFYLEYTVSQIVSMHSVPGAPLNELFVVDMTYTNNNQSPNAVLVFRDYQGAFFEVPSQFYSSLTILAVETNTMEGKNGTADLIAELKAAGVDTNNYDAVAAYFGLE